MYRLTLLSLCLIAAHVAGSRLRRQIAPNCIDAWVNIPNPCTNNPRNVIYFPHPRDTTKFIQCDQLKRMYIIQCPANTVYNTATRSCTAPVTTQTPVTVGSSNPCTTQNLAQGKIYFSIPGDNTHFIECGPAGDANILPCPTNLVWEESKLSCVYRFQAGQTDPSPTGGAQLGQGVSNPCDKQHVTAGHNLFFSHPDPTKFIQCGIAHDAYVLSCPSGLVWNEYSSTCVSPYASNSVAQGN